jgi:DNA-directed RNA polymerase specialized sigma subunit
VPNGSSEDTLIDAIIIDYIYEYIDKNLSEKEAAVFRLKYYYRLNLDEISVIVETSVSSISRMLGKITKEIEEKFPDIL